MSSRQSALTKWGALLLGIFLVTGCGPSIQRLGVPSDTGSTPKNFKEKVEEMRTLGRTWLFSNQLETGQFLYDFNVSRNYSRPELDNAIRQIMASRQLAIRASENPAQAADHQRNLDFIFREWYREAGTLGYIERLNKSKLGANGLMLRVFAESPFFEQYREPGDKIAAGVVAIQHEDGSFEPWFIEPSYAYDREHLLHFYSGEALLGLVEYYKKTEEQRWLDAAIRGHDFYLTEYVENINQNYHPAYVPWHVMSLNNLYKLTQDQRYADAVYILTDKVLELLDRQVFVGRFYDPATPEYGTPHSSSDGVYTEGLAYAYEIAILNGDEIRQQRYRKALELAIFNLASLQYRYPVFDEGQVEPSKYIGGIRIRHDSSWIRIDTIGHALDAFDKILEILETYEVEQ